MAQQHPMHTASCEDADLPEAAPLLWLQACVEDLAQHPHNVWALSGLAASRAFQGLPADNSSAAELAAAQGQPDAQFASSCLAFA